MNGNHTMGNTTGEIKYWKGIDDLEGNPGHEEEKKSEFAEPIPLDAFVESIGLKKVSPRRDFLKSIGFGIGAASLAACNKAPIHKAVPYLIKPDEVTPGIPNYYTSSFDGYSVLVKTREGRPIKIEGNPHCPMTAGGVDATGQASVLGVYDSAKLKGPQVEGNDSTWNDLDTFVSEKLEEFKKNNRPVRIVSPSINSPSTQRVLSDFLAQYPNARWIQYEPFSYSAISQAGKNCFDREVIPSYRFDLADVIVGVNADFLGSWLSPVEFTRQYVSGRATRKLEEKKMSRHFQFETGMSLTGTNADFRYPIRPSEEGTLLVGLYDELARLGGTAPLGGGAIAGSTYREGLQKTAKALWIAKGKSLVISGSNDVSNQILVLAINHLLGNIGKTVDFDNYSLQKSSNDAAFMEMVQSMKLGEIDGIIFYGVNPGYDFADKKGFSEGLKLVKLKVSLSERMDETSALCQVVAPDQHYLESWNDYQPKKNYLSIQQPTINPIFDSRTGQQNFINWTFMSRQHDLALRSSARPQKGSVSASAALPGDSLSKPTALVGSSPADSSAAAGLVPVEKPTEYADYLKSNWENHLFGSVGMSGDFTTNWEDLLRKGFVASPAREPSVLIFNKDLTAVAQKIVQNTALSQGAFEVHLYQSVGLRDGRFSNNPWLLELPDPVTKVTWDNYIAMSLKTVKDLHLRDGDFVAVTVGGRTETFPVLVQPGQANGTGSIALGFGRTAVGKAGNQVGKNAYPFVQLVNGSFQYHNQSTLAKTGEGYEFARTQDHNTIEGRSMTKETILSEYIKNPYAGSGRNDKEEEEKANAWDDFPKKGHHWGMSIDLNACTGCGACIVACNAENNVAVVGREEVHRRREMHWLRIDRYYSFNDHTGKAYTKESELKQIDREGILEKMDNVSVYHQPMLCQHCDHAPCETVCPVLATMHSSEGLNMQIYNRCFGTRYCANNCPYKVRRFNWFKYFDNDQFDYQMNDSLGKMVLNPDVTVRSRGVMEKCTFCVQRIQAGKLEAKIAGKPLFDGEVQTACQQTCPASAIVFGDINDPNSEVSKLLKNERTYYVLDELGVRPGIGYMTKVRNRDLVFNEANPESL